MTDTEELAAQIAARLRDEHVIPATLPADVGNAIADAASHGSMYWTFTIPLRGPNGLSTYWTLAPDGSLHLDLRRWDGSTFWRGTFQSVRGTSDG